MITAHPPANNQSVKKRGAKGVVAKLKKRKLPHPLAPPPEWLYLVLEVEQFPFVLHIFTELAPIFQRG